MNPVYVVFLQSILTVLNNACEFRWPVKYTAGDGMSFQKTYPSFILFVCEHGNSLRSTELDPENIGSHGTATLKFEGKNKQPLEIALIVLLGYGESCFSTRSKKHGVHAKCSDVK